MKNVLIVDDIKGWRDFHEQALKAIFDEELKIDKAECAKDGYDKVLENNNSPYDIILTDLQMELDYEPKLAGEWLVEQIKMLPRYYKTKIVMISATYNIRQIAENSDVLYIPKSVARVSLESYKETLMS